MTKRLLDIAVAIAALILFLPVVLVISFFVLLMMGRPIFFTQRRPGLNGEPFTLIKFRTMRDAQDVEGKPRPDSERLSSFGRFLRSTSLDELPELWNVLTGSMSLVGPRPLLMEYMPLYSQRQARRHEIRPGITGWAQVNGRNSLSWEDRFELDVWYVDNQSLLLDLKILLLTIGSVIGRKDISHAGESTMSKFTGSVR